MLTYRLSFIHFQNYSSSVEAAGSFDLQRFPLDLLISYSWWDLACFSVFSMSWIVYAGSWLLIRLRFNPFGKTRGHAFFHWEEHYFPWRVVFMLLGVICAQMPRLIHLGAANGDILIPSTFTVTSWNSFTNNCFLSYYLVTHWFSSHGNSSLSFTVSG